MLGFREVNTQSIRKTIHLGRLPKGFPKGVPKRIAGKFPRSLEVVIPDSIGIHGGGAGSLRSRDDSFKAIY
jgi:hypothetical protein